jgi:TolA-binding protein
VLSLLLPSARRLAAEDKWYELYQSALKAISSHKWAEAEKKLKGAIETGPLPGRQVRMYGVRFIDYLPEYQLGLVYFNQQRYADALEQFAKVQAAGEVTQGDAEYPTLADMLELCRIRTAAKPADGQKESETLVRYARDLMGRHNLEEARRVLDSSAAKAPGSPEVAAAREQLVRLETEARMQAEERTRAAAAGHAEDERLIEAAGKALDSGKYAEARGFLEKLSSAADPRAKQIASETDLRQGITEVTVLISAGKLAAAEQQWQRLERLHPGDPRLAELEADIRRGRPATPPPEPPRDRAAADVLQERAAFEAFYSGDYRGAAARFETLATNARSGRERWLAYAACSRAGASLLDSTDGQKELNRARTLYAQAGPAGARMINRDGLVSPRIVRALKAADRNP